ncbi:hypothetical protein RF11_06640 [Thelohanellus kitauei]|uniref:Myb/SANT-like DNA-binding domain-containing protein n=1 Tax=Thelohanellus kitauei TaxID=669202 RepID=A0A0C2IHG0_THEKT|nr:hypothetical protein RF11_06640 [Thelohanellus kitauei]
MIPKKQRGMNFTENEKAILIELIERTKGRMYDSFNRNKNIKKDEWNEIYREFIRRMGGRTERTLSQIKVFWKNYSAKCKKTDTKRRTFSCDTSLMYTDTRENIVENQFNRLNIGPPIPHYSHAIPRPNSRRSHPPLIHREPREMEPRQLPPRIEDPERFLGLLNELLVLTQRLSDIVHRFNHLY